MFVLLSMMFGSALFAAPFETGETMEYDIEALGLDAAKQKIVVEEMTNINGRDAFRIHSWIRTTSFGDAFYKMRDETLTYIDAETYTVLKMIDKKQEGDWKNDTFITNDIGAHVYYLNDRHGPMTKSYNPPLLDLVAMIYYGRTIDLQLDKKYSFEIIDGRSIRRIDTIVSDKFERKEPAIGKAKFSMIKIKEIKTDSKSKDVAIWLTNDERRIPVRIISMKIKLLGISLGNVQCVLKKYKKN